MRDPRRSPGRDAVQAFAAATRSFGDGAADAKLRLLAEVPDRSSLAPEDVESLRQALNFTRAYPDDARVLRAVRDVRRALPAPPPVVHPFSWGTLQRLVRLDAARVEIEWDDVEDDALLSAPMEFHSTPGEAQGVADTSLTFRDWFDRCRPPRHASDLAFLVARIASSGLPEMIQASTFERCNLPVRWHGPASVDIELPPDLAPRLFPQRAPLERERFDLAPVVRTPHGDLRPLGRAQGEAVITTAVLALAARSLEIFPLLHANADDVVLVDGGRGFRIAFIGVRPAARAAFETLGVFLVTKNGVPMGYGPVGAFLGCCEMGINLFPEFRGAEIRYVWAQVMRGLHHLYGVEHFFLRRYGMGEGNPEAIDTGAFWFYRKLGFLPDNPAVERLAREEEARMAADPSHRSSRAMLRRLSHTEAHLDLSSGRRVPFNLGALGIAESRFIGRAFDGDHVAAIRECSKRIVKLLGPRVVGDGLAAMAPALSMIDGLATWPRRDLAALARIVIAKGRASEMETARLLASHARLEAALRAIVAAG